VLKAVLQVVQDVATALDEAGVQYVVGGSVASSLLGEVRTTNDIDLAVFLPEARLAAAIAQLDELFFVDADAARDAVRRRASFNIFHRTTMFKVDLFVLAGSAFDRERMKRRSSFELISGSGKLVALPAPEDVVLRKLAWFRDGGGSSDRQWRDVLGVLKTQRAKLDLDYARRWARELDVSELLERAISESGSG
jgi:fructose-specific component phosphotransferase system IIB-like protein